MGDLGVGEANHERCLGEAHMHIGDTSAASTPTSMNIHGADAQDAAGLVAHAGSTHSHSEEARRRRSAAKNKNRKAKEPGNTAK
jgi:hypothetical protein